MYKLYTRILDIYLSVQGINMRMRISIRRYIGVNGGNEWVYTVC
jgi:hypothetical protein